MTTFDDRLQAELAKFQHDLEFEFRVRLRRDKLFGLKIAEKLGLDEAAALDYAKAVVSTDFSEVGDDPLLAKVIEDLRAKGAPIDPVGLQRELEKVNAIAQDQMMHE